MSRIIRTSNRLQKGRNGDDFHAVGQSECCGLPLREAVGVPRASNSYTGSGDEQCLEVIG